MLLGKPTAYRKNYVSKLENVVVGNCEIDRLVYQEDRLSSRNYEKKFHAFEISQQNEFSC